VDPLALNSDVFASHQYHLANVSCPFFFDGERRIPKILEVARRVTEFGVDVQIAIIVRDQNINQLQQLRVRKMHTTPLAQEYYYDVLLPSGFPVHFLDHEAFFLHRQHYLRWVSKILKFPIDTENPEILKFIDSDANHKYVKYLEEHWLDEVILAGCQPDRDNRLTAKTDK
jgi:hypothetical protein